VSRISGRLFAAALSGALALGAAPAASRSTAIQSSSATDAIAWYDTLGFPNTKGLPYVRVGTGRWRQVGNGPRENRFVEGFLLREDAESFTVFLCNVAEFKTQWEDRAPYAQLTTVRFVRRVSAPAAEQVSYQPLDFRKVATDVLDRVRRAASQPEELLHDSFSRPVSHRVRIFAFARAALQNGLPEVATPLIELAARIRIDQTGVVDPSRLRDVLQQQIGDAVLAQAEIDAVDPAIPWTTLLAAYEGFDARFPASRRIDYAREAADALRMTIVEDGQHHPPPLEQMSPAEQAAEQIYQLRNLKLGFPYWTNSGRYPVDPFNPREGKDTLTPVHRLVDLGFDAVPLLIEALDNRRFTRTEVASFNGAELPVAMRVSDFARGILEFVSGRNFFPRKSGDGRLVNGTVRQQAEAWWADVLRVGKEQQLINDTSAGGPNGLNSAHQLVQHYPDAAIPAIETAIHSTRSPAERGEYVQLAGLLNGDGPVAFLRSQMTPAAGEYAQVAAANALFTRGAGDVVPVIPVIIEAWRTIQARVPVNQDDAYYDEAGLIIGFLAGSGHVDAIDALAQDLRRAPVDTRLGVVTAFRAPAKSAGSSADGRVIRTRDVLETLPAGDAAAAIERLLISSLDDTQRRVGMTGQWNEISFKDPRICDMAAFVLSTRWPAKYRFQWLGSDAERDAQIASIRAAWRDRSPR
jgi:hypothetical protein